MFRSLFIFLILFTGVAHPQTEPTRYDLEAAFVYKFIKFVDWPESNANQEYFDLCYTGSGEIKPAILALGGKEIKNVKIEVRSVDDHSQLNGCKLLFIDIPDEKLRNGYVTLLIGRDVLTVSHFEGFAENGGMINLVLNNNKIQFEINFISAEKSNIKVSSKLLRLANKVIAAN